MLISTSILVNSYKVTLMGPLGPSLVWTDLDRDNTALDHLLDNIVFFFANFSNKIYWINGHLEKV